MRLLMQKICSERGSLLMLEIGSWAGESAILWAEVAKQTLREKHRQLPSIICVDPWTSYLSLDGTPHLRTMRKAALRDKIFSLFLHNIKSSGNSDVIIPLRTWSHVAARFFRTDLFDMVFIDGDHAYSSVAGDIRDYAPLVMDGGYICGDDLELQMSEIDRNFARTHPDEDMVRDASTGRDFHPGVTLAVGEFFGEVSAYAGFWVMQKVGSAWRKVVLQ
jgi:predicted O-methyltransferase YrrM